jgi:tetratricopeptide (TPR) repeat protein
VTASPADLSRAGMMIDLGRFGDAVRVLTTVVAATPDSARAWCLLARAQLGGGNEAGAVQAAHRASELDPADDWPYRLASTALIGLGRADDAVAAAVRARNLAPHFWRSHVCLAQAAVAAGQLDLAGRARAAALAIAPGEPDVHVTAGKVALGAGDLDQARASQQAALAIDPANVGALNELGLISLRGRDAPAAAGYFLRAVRSAPGTGVFGQNAEVALARVALSVLAWATLLAALAACTATLALAGWAPFAIVAGLLGTAVAGRMGGQLCRVPGPFRRRLPPLLWTMAGLRGKWRSAMSRSRP